MVSELAIQAAQLMDKMSELNRVADNALETNKAENTNGFSNLVTDAIASVDHSQKMKTSLEKKYLMQDPSVSLSNVMIQMQKSQVSLNALIQVRNKIVDGYKQIEQMNI